MVVQGYIIRTVLMLLLVFGLANGSQGSVGSTQTLIEESKAIQMSLGSNFNIGQIMYINSYFYGIMRFTLGVIDYSMLFKRDLDFLNGWSAAISMQTLDQAAGTTAIGDTFDISSTYTFLIFGGVIDPTNTHKAYISYIAESTGTISYSYLYSNLYILHSILLSGDDTTLFGIGRDSSNNGLIGSLSMLSLSTGTGKNYNSFQTVSLYYLSTSNNGESIIFTFFDKSVSPYKFGIAKFISNSGVSGLAYDWVSQLNYYNSASVSTIRNAVLYSSGSSTSSTTDTIYNLALINSNILVLIQILKTTGLTSQTIYALDSSGGSTTYSFIDFTGSDNIVYILAASSTQSFIHTYDQNTLTIGTSYSVITFQTQSTDFLDSLFIMSGYNSGTGCGIFKKVNIFNIQQGNTDNDSNYPLSVYTSQKFTAASSSNYNITTYTITTSVTSLTPSGALDSSYVYSSPLSQSYGSTPSTQYTSTAAYSADISIDIYVQTSKTATYTYTEPGIVPPNVDTITFSISSSYSWITFDVSTDLITVNAPVISGVAYNVYSAYIIGTTSLSERLASIINVFVFTCSDSNCLTGSYSTRTTCSACISGYTLTSGSGVKNSVNTNTSTSSSTSSSSENTNKYSTHALVTEIVILSVILLNFIGAMASLSSLHSIWSMINQYQLYLILPLVGWYMDQSVINYINDFQFLTFNLSFIPISDLGIFTKIYNFLTFPQANASLMSLGLNSGSTLINYLSVVMLTLLFIILHLLFLLLNKLVTPRLRSDKMKNAMLAIFYLFTFRIYLRVIGETFMFMGISVTFELKKFDVSSTGKIVSIIFAFITIFLTIVFVLFVIAHFWKTRTVEHSNMNKMYQELYEETKDSKIGKLYSIVYFLRRLLIGIIITLGYSNQLKREFWALFLQILLSIVQVISAVYISIRPFKKVKDNLIEGLDDWILLLLSVTFIVCNQNDMWSSTFSQTIIYLLTSNSVIINIILLIDILVHFVKWIAKKFKAERIKSYSESPNKSKPETSRKLNDKQQDKVVLNENNFEFYPQIVNEEEKQKASTSVVQPHSPIINNHSDNSEISGKNIFLIGILLKILIIKI